MNPNVKKQDSWDMIVLHRQNHKSMMERLRNRQKRRKVLLITENEHSSTPSPSANNEEDIITTQLVDPIIESKLLSLLAESLTLVPLKMDTLLKKLQTRLTDNKAGISDVHVILEKFSAQNLITLGTASNDVSFISSKVLDIASMMEEELKLAEEAKQENKGDKETKRSSEVIEENRLENRVEVRRKRIGEIPLETKKPKLQAIEELLKIPSVREATNRKVSEEVQELLNASTTMEQMNLNKFKSQGISKVREFCTNGTREECRRANRSSKACNKLHFIRVIQKHTDKSLGDCSFLNTCFHTDTCKYVHYKVDEVYDDREEENKARELKKKDATMKPIHGLQTKIVPAQWISCDLRYLDLKVLGKFSVIMADPPWDIHMELPYGTMSDDEMRKLPIPALQDDGFIFLWVTGRAMELGRECLAVWGYERVDEVVWVKTNQLQRLIRTGRTGHWINHGKEHCLVGAKGEVKYSNKTYILHYHPFNHTITNLFTSLYFGWADQRIQQFCNAIMCQVGSYRTVLSSI